jgi:aspartyl/asparaginyl-tRNA synthetase
MSSRYISMQGTRVKVKKIFESSDMLGKEIVVKGWVKTLRDQKNFAFIEVNDGSTLSGIQAVVDASIPTFDEIKKCEIYYVLNRIHTVLILQPFPSHFLDSQLAQQ